MKLRGHEGVELCGSDSQQCAGGQCAQREGSRVLTQGQSTSQSKSYWAEDFPGGPVRCFPCRGSGFDP